MSSFPLDQLPNVISQCNEYKDQSITFTHSPDIDLSTEELTINNDLTLTFASREFSCKRIFICNCKVEIHNLSMTGSITVDNGTLTLYDSTIKNPNNSIDYILVAQKDSTVTATNCTFSGTKHFGISGDDHSFLFLDHCALSDIELYGIVLTCYSKLRCTHTTFINLESDSIYVADSCGANILHCEFSGSQKRAITVKNGEYLVFDNSIVKNCTLSAFYISCCSQFLMTECKIIDCSHTAIYLERVLGVIKKTIISRCNGNGVNASHSSKILITKCNLSHTTFPPIAICESSFGSIKKCEISDSDMSGVIVRSNSQAAIEDTTIQNIKLFGISISDSREVTVKRSLIIKCDNSAIAVYNNSKIKVKSTNLVGPCLYGINTFTGGFVNAIDTAILGMSKSAIWLHHSGAGLFEKLILSAALIAAGANIPEIVSNFDFEKRDDQIERDRLILNESKRFLMCKDSFALGIGHFELEKNIESEDPPIGVNAIKGKCQKCGDDASSCIYTRCGHTVYCRKCWDALETKPEFCELCLMPVSGVVAPINCSHEDEEGICSICFTEQSDSVILPCGHTICWTCACQWFGTSMDCPFCREKNARPQRFVSYE
ncbi:hypothetical protein TRFO_16222 [Tritrichomonas foetus]|uniref:RING-type domain-containing protein n=1 Tax=Tritrichomonas foetus TaxID=1144522 RepID=A0A1J4KVC9_9EUKA|nr:hypothetical protein TRFO_16222 [Tritrichomonas foetus]|eukprot:OHT13654.1 hypothetical protein TRFO_16222 [Tritrichomonas foetus]